MVHYLKYFVLGLLLPLGFAPFHLPGLAIISLTGLYYCLTTQKYGSALIAGLVFGLGYFGFGVSWIYVSIHEYGHLNSLISAIITLLFIVYLSLFPSVVAGIYTRYRPQHLLLSGVLFSAIWIVSEFVRASFLSGFPWLLIGFGQFDAPTKFLLPIVGVYGVGFITCFAAALLGNAMLENGIKRQLYIIGFISIFLCAYLFQTIHWSKEATKPISVGVIQANISMRDKWDEDLFWTLLHRYQNDTEALLGTDLIVLPESAIPLPAYYINDYLNDMQLAAKTAGSAILLGIPQPTTNQRDYFNTLMSLGKAKGTYLKQHLVPFGEYIPGPFQAMSEWLGVPDANLKPGSRQSLVHVHQHPIASLICYELAYGNLLRGQLPEAEWIVSISDDGWFGRSLAPYQQRQMAQVRSLETARYQVVANNDGLSAIINARGTITDSLPAFSDGILKASIFPATGSTPWIIWGDWPFIGLSFLILIGFLVRKHLLQTTRGGILTNP